MTNRADQITALVAALDSDTTGQGFTIDELAGQLGWPRDRVNDRLCDLLGQVSHEKVRGKDRKAVNRYKLKTRGHNGNG